MTEEMFYGTEGGKSIGNNTRSWN